LRTRARPALRSPSELSVKIPALLSCPSLRRCVRNVRCLFLEQAPLEQEEGACRSRPPPRFGLVSCASRSRSCRRPRSSQPTAQTSRVRAAGFG
jgi:hypothetical protein